MISALCRSKLVKEAKQLASEFEMKYDKYDVVILNSMLCAYCRSGEMENVMKMMKKMDESAISPDWSTFKILIKYFCKEQLYLLAYRTMEDMHKKGHQPLEVNTWKYFICADAQFYDPHVLFFILVTFAWGLFNMIAWCRFSSLVPLYTWFDILGTEIVGDWCFLTIGEFYCFWSYILAMRLRL